VTRVELLRDADRPDGWLLLVDGVPQSYVDPTDPTHLEFGYVRTIASLVDAALPASSPLSVVHVGGGALTLPRWVSATRPRSRQLVLEPDADVTAYVRAHLPLPRGHGVRVRAEGGRSGLASRPDGSADLVILDAFTEGRVPSELTTVEFVTDVRRVLVPSGLYLANLADAPPLRFARRAAATVRQVFDEVYVLAEAPVLRGRRFGNVVVVGTSASIELDVLARALRARPFPVSVLNGAQLEAFVGTWRAIHDRDTAGGAAGAASPEPPDGTWRIPRM
jgi:spermidine synthase